MEWQSRVFGGFFKGPEVDNVNGDDVPSSLRTHLVSLAASDQLKWEEGSIFSTPGRLIEAFPLKALLGGEQMPPRETGKCAAANVLQTSVNSEK